jgi:maleylpyruvate isomerase
MTMRLYGYWRSSATYRLRLALAHKDLPYEVVPVSLLTQANRSPEHLARNPMGQVPVLEVEDAGKPAFLVQSLPIIEYLEERYPERPLLPKQPIARAQARELAELINAGIQPHQNLPVLKRIDSELKGDSKEWARFFIGRGLEALEARATQTAGDYLVADAVSVADVFLLPQLYNARRFNVSLEPMPTLRRVEARCLALPRWDRAAPERQPDAEPSP